MIRCLLCGRGWCEECKKCRKGKCHSKVEVSLEGTIEVTGEFPTQAIKERKDRTRAGLKDPQSTGRKRAARLYPIDPDAPCEWRGLKYAGGGRNPIIGCLAGIQKHRHHGPVKNTVRNHAGNVHRICEACHVRWHELNDLVYDEKEYALLPHEPVEASPEELVQNDLDWKSGAMGKRFTLASSANKHFKVVD